MFDELSMLGFGPEGWGRVLLQAGLMTLVVSLVAFLIGLFVGTIVAWGRVSGTKPVRMAASAYVSVFRGVPDILVIYLFFFGGRQAVTFVGTALGIPGPYDVSAFGAGALAVGLISAAMLISAEN